MIIPYIHTTHIHIHTYQLYHHTHTNYTTIHIPTIPPYTYQLYHQTHATIPPYTYHHTHTNYTTIHIPTILPYTYQLYHHTHTNYTTILIQYIIMSIAVKYTSHLHLPRKGERVIRHMTCSPCSHPSLGRVLDSSCRFSVHTVSAASVGQQTLLNK